MAKGQKIRLNEVRLSFCHIFEKKDWNDGTEAKYQLRLLINPENKELLKLIKDTTDLVITENKSMFGKSKNLLKPLHREEEEIDGVLYYYINTSTNKRPKIVDRKAQPITNEEEVYSGCYGNVVVYLNPFSKAGKKGVQVLLNGVQKVQDGDRLDGGGCDFDAIDEDDSGEDGDFTNEFDGEIKFK